MQEMTFPQLVEQIDAPFDDYRLYKSDVYEDDYSRAVCMFSKQDTNGKLFWLVADRVRVGFVTTWETRNVKEFKHAKSRAELEYIRRKDGYEDEPEEYSVGE
jgi:hypothetical protein